MVLALAGDSTMTNDFATGGDSSIEQALSFQRFAVSSGFGR
jgi:hypothetical protein